MADFDAFRDLTEAERKNWQNVQRESRGAADRAGYAGKEKARDLIQDYERKAKELAADGGRELEGGRSR